MNNKAHLLCDASYDSSLNIGVAAYSLVAQGKTTRKTIRLSNVSTSQECELVAINEGLRALAIQMGNLNAHGGNKIQQMHIFTDSQHAIDHVKAQQRSYTNRERLFRPLIDTCKTYLRLVSHQHLFHKVASHVPTSRATHIEQAHNMVDNMAGLDLIEFRREILSPVIEHTKTLSIILDDDVSHSDQQAYRQFGFNIAEKGYHVRYITCGDSDKPHPILEGVLYYCKTQDLDNASRMTKVIARKVGEYDRFDTSLNSGAFGLDLCLYQRAMGKLNLKDEDCFNDHALTYAAVSRLLFGIQTHVKAVKPSTKTVSKREGSPSELLLHLGDQHQYQNVLKGVQRIIGYPVYRSLDELLTQRTDLNVRDSVQAVPRSGCALLP